MNNFHYLYFITRFVCRLTWFTKRCIDVAQGHKYGEPSEYRIYFSVVINLRDKLVNRYTTSNCTFLLLPLQFMTRTATMSQRRWAEIKCMHFFYFYVNSCYYCSVFTDAIADKWQESLRFSEIVQTVLRRLYSNNFISWSIFIDARRRCPLQS